MRIPRRAGVDDPAPIPVKTALEYELTGSWPSAKERNRFWDGSGVSRYLRFGPDPRVVHMSEEGFDKHAAAIREWRAARIRWLSARA